MLSQCSKKKKKNIHSGEFMKRDKKNCLNNPVKILFSKQKLLKKWAITTVIEPHLLFLNFSKIVNALTAVWVLATLQTFKTQRFQAET